MGKYERIEEVEKAPFRKFIDVKILQGKSHMDIAKEISIEYDCELLPDAVERYDVECFKKGNNTVLQIALMATDLAKHELPAISVSDKLAYYFSFQAAVEQLDLLYDRIRKLKVKADLEIEDPSYDKRIKENIAQCEAIRVRVFNHEYENLRKAAIMTVGKKIISAAVSILLPYIHTEHRAEAMKRFQSSIEPLLDPQLIPDAPIDVVPS